MKALFRFASFLALLLAFVVLVVDGATILSAKTFLFTSFGELVARFSSAGMLDRLAATIARNIHPAAWGVLNLVVFAPPAVLILAICGIGCWMIGREKDPDLVLARQD